MRRFNLRGFRNYDMRWSDLHTGNGLPPYNSWHPYLRNKPFLRNRGYLRRNQHM